MPMPSVEPMPPLLALRLAVPEDAHDASYLAASARIASLARVSSADIRSVYVRAGGKGSVLTTRDVQRIYGSSDLRCGADFIAWKRNNGEDFSPKLASMCPWPRAYESII